MLSFNALLAFFGGALIAVILEEITAWFAGEGPPKIWTSSVAYGSGWVLGVVMSHYGLL